MFSNPKYTHRFVQASRKLVFRYVLFIFCSTTQELLKVECSTYFHRLGADIYFIIYNIELFNGKCTSKLYWVDPKREF